MLPTLSVITPVLNARSAFLRSVQSIRDQHYPNLEWIVIDGGSTDGTLKAIHTHQKWISQWISESDRGISDAFNKGLNRAKGEYLYFLGAGDFFWTPDALVNLMQGVDPSQDTLVCGQVVRVCEHGQKVLWQAPKKIRLPFKRAQLLQKMILPHQGLCTHRRFFDQFGGFRPEVKFAMDYDLLLRAYHDFPKVHFKPIQVAAWAAGGVGHNKIRAILREYHELKKANQVAPVWILNAIHAYNLSKAAVKTVLGYPQ